MKITGSKIGFGTYSIYAHPEGMYVDGRLSSRELTVESSAQGSVSGYAVGKSTPFGYDAIQKFSFTIDTNSTEAGELTTPRDDAAGQSSATHGYTSGGYTSPLTIQNIIDKFPFATSTGATNVGDLSNSRSGNTGHTGPNKGYTSAGKLNYSNPGRTTSIESFPFAVDTNSAEIGNLTAKRDSAAGQSSANYGYTSGGIEPTVPGSYVNIIDKFPFASETDATDVGDLTKIIYTAAGQSSGINGYLTGGINSPIGPAGTTEIERFSFASDTGATVVGNLTQSRWSVSGQSSTTNGYTSGGRNPSVSNTIDRFPFADESISVDVGNLGASRTRLSGNQV